jgi:hypothetical protein
MRAFLYLNWYSGLSYDVLISEKQERLYAWLLTLLVSSILPFGGCGSLSKVTTCLLATCVTCGLRFLTVRKHRNPSYVMSYRWGGSIDDLTLCVMVRRDKEINCASGKDCAWRVPSVPRGPHPAVILFYKIQRVIQETLVQSSQGSWNGRNTKHALWR